MNKVGQRIVFEDLQIQKGNNQKRMIKELIKDLAAFKTLPDDYEFDEVYNYLFENKYTKNYICANLFPQDINLISEYREAGRSNQVKFEFRWQMKTFSKFAYLINLFIERKNTIENLILLNRYDEALELLETLEREQGFSYWLLENKIFLWKKLNKDTQKEIIGKSHKDIITTILRFYDMRSSDEVSSRDYSYFTKREIARFRRIYPDEMLAISFYHYMIAPFSFETDDENLHYMLEFMHNLPLFDRYLCIVDLCEYILLESTDVNYKEYLNEYICYLDEINDPIVTVFRFILDSKENRRENYYIDDTLMPLKEKYILGDIEGCYQQIVQHINENVSNVAAYNLYIEVCQILGKNVENIDVSDNIKMIIKNLNSVYSIDENYNESIDEIYKLCYCNVHSVWARNICNWISRRSQPYKRDTQIIASKYTNMHMLTIETICENLSSEDAIDYLNSFGNSDNEYVHFWRNLVEGKLSKAKDKCGQNALNTLLNLMNSDKYSDFKPVLLETDKLPPIYKIRCSKVMWNNMTFESYIEDGIDYFIHLFIQRKDYAVVAPMDKFMDYFSQSESVDKRNLRVPIFYYIYTTYFDADRRDELSYICEDFFLYNNIEKPSLMREIDENYSKEELVFFLRYVCIPQIMGPVLLTIRSSKDLDQERINICQNLRLLDPENEDIYEQEIRDITHKLFINEGLKSIENSKIHVNTEGIKLRVSQNLKSDFNNYIYYRNNKYDTFFKTFKSIEGYENFKIIPLDTSQMFSEIVKTIRNEFVSSGEYGLDGYLSLNIRHGTLAGQLKAPLAKYNLLTTYMVETNTYDINNRWLYRIQSRSDKDKIRSAIVDFNNETEEIIEYLRKTLIQVSTEEKPTNGIFNYAWSEGQIKYLQTLLNENDEFEEFIDKIFDYLWQVTECNLEKMKEVIRDEIKHKYIDAFAKLQVVMKGVSAKEPFPEALRWLNEAQNDIDAELEKICNWFKRSAESQHADFDLDLAFQIGFKMIQNIYPQKKFEIRELNTESKAKIAGIYLKNYWNIFYTLFDNVSKYALEEDGVRYISCDLKVDSTGIYIKMTNSYDCSHGVDSEMNKLDTALSLIEDKAYLTRAKQEGGSGIPKIYKILSVDLDKKANIKYSFLPENNQFIIMVEGKNK